MQKCKIRRLATWILLKSTSNKNEMSWQPGPTKTSLGVGKKDWVIYTSHGVFDDTLVDYEGYLILY